MEFLSIHQCGVPPRLSGARVCVEHQLTGTLERTHGLRCRNGVAMIQFDTDNSPYKCGQSGVRHFELFHTHCTEFCKLLAIIEFRAWFNGYSSLSNTLAIIACHNSKLRIVSVSIGEMKERRLSLFFQPSMLFNSNSSLTADKKYGSTSASPLLPIVAAAPAAESRNAECKAAPCVRQRRVYVRHKSPSSAFKRLSVPNPMFDDSSGTRRNPSGISWF